MTQNYKKKHRRKRQEIAAWRREIMSRRITWFSFLQIVSWQRLFLWCVSKVSRRRRKKIFDKGSDTMGYGPTCVDLNNKLPNYQSFDIEQKEKKCILRKITVHNELRRFFFIRDWL